MAVLAGDGGTFSADSGIVQVTFTGKSECKSQPERINLRALADRIEAKDRLEICEGVIVIATDEEVKLEYRGRKATFPRNAFLAYILQ